MRLVDVFQIPTSGNAGSLYAISQLLYNIRKLDKADLVNIIDSIFKPIGYKRKGNYWNLQGTEIMKIIYLQKSAYSKSYYINYGFNFPKLQYTEVIMHIYRGLGSSEEKLNELIKSLLNFENEIPDYTRKIELTNILNGKLKIELNKINSESDIVKELKENPIHLSSVTLKVKEYLKLN